MVRIGARSSSHARRSPGRRKDPKGKRAKRSDPQRRNHRKAKNPRTDKREPKVPENFVTRQTGNAED